MQSYRESLADGEKNRLKPSTKMNPAGNVQNKRQALGTITNKTTNIRIQPAKRETVIPTKGLSIRPNTKTDAENIRPDGKGVFGAKSSKDNFKIFEDEIPPVGVIEKKVDSVTLTSAQSAPRQPLASIDLSTITTAKTNDESNNTIDLLSDVESPMCLDSSLLKKQTNDDDGFVRLDCSDMSGLLEGVDDRLCVKDDSFRKEEPDGYLTLLSDYNDYIYEYLLELEKKIRPNPNYMNKQPDINWGMRKILVDWLVEVAEEYKLQTETLHLAVSFSDRFLSRMSVLRGKLQLVGTSCMFLAAKYEEIYPPDIGEFVYITDDTYTKKQVLRMERLILKELKFDLSAPTAYYFLRRYCALLGLNKKLQYLATYLAELALLEGEDFLRFMPSIIACSCLYVAHITFNIEEPWSAELRDLTGYTLEDLNACVSNVMKVFVAAPEHQQQAIREKYKSPKFNSVSLLMPPRIL